MKANEILNVLGLKKPNQAEKSHAKKLSDIFGLMASLKPVQFLEVKIEPAHGFTFGSYSIQGNQWRKPEQFQSELKMNANRITVKTVTGQYVQNIPTTPDIYLPFLKLFPPHLITQPIKKEYQRADVELYFGEDQTEAIKRAAKFVGKNDFHPALNCVFIEVKNGLVNIAATDAHKLFTESFSDTIGLLPEGVFLLPGKDVSKAKKEIFVELFSKEGIFETGKINGLSFEVCNERYPDYKQVIPQYDKFVECDRKELINAVKGQLPFSNKTTHQIKFHFNGSVAISAQDLDFANESWVKIPYSLKTTPDFEIGVNGKFLLESLSTLQDKTVKIYSEGKPSKAVLLNSSVLLMPVMLNQYA